MREKLVTQFPNCFKPAGESRLPLKIGIRQDIMGALPDVSRNDLKLTLSNYVRDKSYREAMIKGAMRVDLDGNPTTAITKEETRWPPQARTDS
jgi:ProP effector